MSLDKKLQDIINVTQNDINCTKQTQIHQLNTILHQVHMYFKMNLN